MAESGHGSIVIFTIGTQGDVRPCVALGQGLCRAGYPVRIATSENFASLVREAGLEFSPLTADFHTMLETDRAIADQGLDLRAMARIFRRRYAEWAPHWVEEGLAASEDAALLIGVSNSTLLARALSELRGVPFAIARLQPLTPSRVLPPLVLSGFRRRLPGALSLAAHHLLFLLVWKVMRPAINDVVRPRLGLRRYPWHGPYLGRRSLHAAKVINGFSPHVVPRPPDWPESSQITGYWFLDQPRWTPPATLIHFLATGPKPIYVGFGSMVSNRSTTFTRTVLEAIERSGQRAVLATGWGGLEGEEGARDERLYFLRHAPHDWLFPRMAAAVHHGGAGTTAAAARAGIPSVIVPFYGDQPFWSRCLHSQGAAPPALDRESLTADALATALAATQRPAMRQAAAALGRAVSDEDGVARAIDQLRRWGLLPGATGDGSPSVGGGAGETR